MKIIPLEKQSKSAQRKFHTRQRGTWNGITPVTRTVPDKTKYNRRRAKQMSAREKSDL